ncbi:hypothetical protein OAJ52_00515 [Bacteroidia bacterium]|nr:hypothetical protein [Bacteroidia bacterium]MDC0104440.1 hypothetical protein [Bacteroidia bacterium]
MSLKQKKIVVKDKYQMRNYILGFFAKLVIASALLYSFAKTGGLI